MESIRGYVEHIVYRNEDNGYTVLNFVTEGMEITCVGIFHSVDEGISMELTGHYTEHATYGSQFQVEDMRELPPEGAAAMERYLGSGMIKGVGPALAARIVKRFGEDTFRIVEEEPERLAEIKGISERRAMEISAQMEEKRSMRDAMIYLQGYGISDSLAVKIYRTYEMDLYRVLEENPYRLAEDIEGIGFRRADELARRIGIHTDSDYRVKSGILYTLQLAGAEGHTCLPQQLLIDKASQLLELSPEYVSIQIPNLAMERKLMVRKGSVDSDEMVVYGANAYFTELSCARMMKDLNVSMVFGGSLLPTEEERLKREVQSITQALKIELDELQMKAVTESAKNGVLILTGGPGTGKTTTISTMIRYFETEGLDILLAAPTGRAARRMTEATGYESKTIHRLLELTGVPDENGGMTVGRGAHFERNEANPLEADVIIVDEMSMVDINLFHYLLKAITPGTRLILVGDVNQLPSVGPGQVLRDLIESKAFPTVCLEKIFRQAGESDIVVNAHRINRGEAIALDNKSKDFFFLERNDPQLLVSHMLLLIREKLPKYVNASPFDIQVMTPTRKGLLGVESLNRVLQSRLNPESDRKKEITVGNTVFREGDKVMQIRNNYQLEWEVLSKYGIPMDSGVGIFNGDMGILKEINEYDHTAVVEFDEQRQVHYTVDQMAELELAYAVTIHKSQGSEYPAVIMPLMGGPKLLYNRNLLYTGVTRARSCLVILGSSQVVQEMIANESEAKRYTTLNVRIQEIMSEE